MFDEAGTGESHNMDVRSSQPTVERVQPVVPVQLSDPSVLPPATGEVVDVVASEHVSDDSGDSTTQTQQPTENVTATDIEGSTEPSMGFDNTAQAEELGRAGTGESHNMDVQSSQPTVERVEPVVPVQLSDPSVLPPATDEVVDVVASEHVSDDSGDSTTQTQQPTENVTATDVEGSTEPSMGFNNTAQAEELGRGKKAKGLIETQPTESSHRLLHLSLSNGRFRRSWWNPESGNDEDQEH
ncbi:hypothetical protein F2Q69_00043592 [Brassica cretica]|uniref:Uncharacterized protein n=1 Tax=Brassica cretica TaxID=69181 RepID=A0A8S9NF32_BRACR|nr:hypothetical protein F2Q69_00043592 [Brassica cretica]